MAIQTIYESIINNLIGNSYFIESKRANGRQSTFNVQGGTH